MIELAAGLAILCLLASGVLDLVFKLYAAQARSRGMLICGVGCVWALLHYAVIAVTDGSLEFSAAVMVWGMAAALCVTLSNLLLVESLGRMPVSVASTIYRLNTVPLVVLAFFFLGEDMNWLRATGVALGIVTVMLLYRPGDNVAGEPYRSVRLLGLIISASVIRALYGIFTKMGIDYGADPDSLILLAALGWCIGGLLYAGIRERDLALSHDRLGYVVIVGVLVYAIIWLLTTALEFGDANVVIPISNLGFFAAFLLSLGFRLERLTLRKLLAIPTAIAAILALTISIG